MGNLFHKLFTFSSASENFLTESFTYILERDKAVLEAFLDRIFEIDVERYEAVARLHEQLTGKTCVP
jgi:hypothetical protein